MCKITKGDRTQKNFTPYYDNVKKFWFGRRQEEGSGVTSTYLI